MNAPNLLTLLRIVLIGPLLWLVFHDFHQAALAVFLLAGATDLLDGWYARKFHLESAAGGVFDAIADKTLMLAVWISLFLLREIPVWGFLIFARDIGVLVNMAAIRLSGRTLSASMSRPNFFGKLTTFLQIFTACFLLAQVESAGLLAVASAFSIVTGLFYISSGT